MNTVKTVLLKLVESGLQLLAGLREETTKKRNVEQLEFAFGMRREFEVNPAVRRKHR